MPGTPQERHPVDERYERWEDRLAWPVLIAALASVPAVFLTLLDGAARPPEAWSTGSAARAWGRDRGARRPVS